MSTHLSNLQNIPTNKNKQPPPLNDWQPSEMVDFPILIKDNGDWWHENTKITRKPLVKLFSSVLWGQNGETFLKTPTHLYRINVENAPFLIVDIIKNDLDELVFVTNYDDNIPLNSNHLPCFKRHHDEWQAYIPVRFELFGKISRNTFYHLLNFGDIIDNDGQLCLQLTSGNNTFNISYPIDA